MSSVLSEYPETLPAPMVGVVTPTERRKVGSIGGVQSFRTVQRDRHGTRTYAFTFTKEQAAIFREWWVEWEQRGGGWFAANWPLPWLRGPNVFRFKNPPEWSLIGGGVDGQGYWRVSGSVEIRGRGMLPTVEVLYLTSTPYPIYAEDSMQIAIGSLRPVPVTAVADGMYLGSEILQILVNGSALKGFVISEDEIATTAKIQNIAATGTIYTDYVAPPDDIVNSASIISVVAVSTIVRYSLPADTMRMSASIIYVGV